MPVVHLMWGDILFFELTTTRGPVLPSNVTTDHWSAPEVWVLMLHIRISVPLKQKSDGGPAWSLGTVCVAFTLFTVIRRQPASSFTRFALFSPTRSFIQQFSTLDRKSVV